LFGNNFLGLSFFLLCGGRRDPISRARIVPGKEGRKDASNHPTMVVVMVGGGGGGGGNQAGKGGGAKGLLLGKTTAELFDKNHEKKKSISRSSRAGLQVCVVLLGMCVCIFLPNPKK
jgi:hypothetical protein